MDGEKLEMAGKAAASVVGYLKPADELSVIAFDALPRVLIPLQPVRDLQSPDELIRSLAANGGTTLDPAIEAAFEMLARSQSSQRHIILLTDGAATDRDPEAIVSEMSASGITLSVVSIGEDANELLLESLSAAGRGRFWRTENPQELPTIVLQDADSTGARAILTDTVVPCRGKQRQCYSHRTSDSFHRLKASSGRNPEVEPRSFFPVWTNFRFSLGGRWGLELSLRLRPTSKAAGLQPGRHGHRRQSSGPRSYDMRQESTFAMNSN